MLSKFRNFKFRTMTNFMIDISYTQFWIKASKDKDSGSQAIEVDTEMVKIQPDVGVF